ncbi:hypothetical protein BT67DRAFT_56162 [Trichocladium antarcticum]|uniref:Uncharacterized protein n=1 Tax=Trichocladium antarcticum TaxID=1450529 RepID=A0AAN6UHP6_9PEZI|nr:hypothetical protein BT67DRAFT_56162 [Trichocladium antarcticum]
MRETGVCRDGAQRWPSCSAPSCRRWISRRYGWLLGCLEATLRLALRSLAGLDSPTYFVGTLLGWEVGIERTDQAGSQGPAEKSGMLKCVVVLLTNQEYVVNGRCKTS